MAVDDKNISYRIYLVAFAILLMAIAIAVKFLLIFSGLKGVITGNLPKRTVRILLFLLTKAIFILQMEVY
jgi:hypothetical protein